MVFLMLVGAGCRTVDGETLDSFGRIVTGLVDGLWLDRRSKDRKPA